MTGRVLGGPADQLSLFVNEAPTEVVLGSDGTFGASVLLQPGLNRLRAVATGPGDARAEGSISIEYVPAGPGRIVFTSPGNGFVLGPDAPPVIVVEGTVEDFSLRRTLLRDADGSFHTVPNGQIQVATKLSRAGGGQGLAADENAADGAAADGASADEPAEP